MQICATGATSEPFDLLTDSQVLDRIAKRSLRRETKLLWSKPSIVAFFTIALSARLRFQFALSAMGRSRIRQLPEI